MRGLASLPKVHVGAFCGPGSALLLCILITESMHCWGISLGWADPCTVQVLSVLFYPRFLLRTTGLFTPGLIALGAKGPHGMKGPRSESYKDFSFSGPFAASSFRSCGPFTPWNICSRGLFADGNFCSGGSTLPKNIIYHFMIKQQRLLDMVSFKRYGSVSQ